MNAFETAVLDKVRAIGGSVDDFKKKMEESSGKTGADLVAYRAQLDELKRVCDEIQEKMRISRATSVGGEARKYSISRALRGMLNEASGVSNAWRGSEYEKEVQDSARDAWNEWNRTHSSVDAHIRQSVSRTSTVANPSQLGLLVPDEVRNDLITLLRSKLVLEKLGVVSITGLPTGHDITWPRELAAGSVGWVGEANPMADTGSGTVGHDRLTPKGLYSLQSMSNALMATSAADQFIQNVMLREMRLEIQRAFISGTGTQFQPQGLSGIALNSTALTGLTAANTLAPGLVKMVANVENQNADPASSKFLLHTRSKNTIWGYTLGTTTPSLFQSGWSTGQSPKLLDYEYETTNTIPVTAGSPDTTDVYFGDWASSTIFYWGAMSILLNTQASSVWLSRSSMIAMVQDMDFHFRQPKAFAVGTAMPLTALA